MFHDNASIHSFIYHYVLKLLYDPVTEELWGTTHFNQLDRNTLGKEFAINYFNYHDKQEIGGEANVDALIQYAARKIDRLIPRLYFLECNKGYVEQYSVLLMKRVFTTKGKDGFPYTKGIRYFFEHDFSKEEEFIKKTAATKKQINYLKELGEKNGYLLCRSEFLSKGYANSLIEYLNETASQEPMIFFFFFLPR